MTLPLDVRLQAARRYAKAGGCVDLLAEALERTGGAPDAVRETLRFWGGGGEPGATDLVAILDGDSLPTGFIAEKLDGVARLHGEDPAAMSALRDVAEAFGVELTGGRDA